MALVDYFYLHHRWSDCFLFFKLLLFALGFLPLSISQQAAAPAAQPSGSCNGVFVSYAYTDGARLPPNVSDPSQQPYRFESTLTVLNHDLNALKSWKAFVGFQHKEILVSASNAVLADGSSLPGVVENGTIFSGFPMSDLKSAIETAGDLTQMQVQIHLVGTQFGVASPKIPMPSNISLANDGWLCPKPTMSTGNMEMHVCCLKDEKFTSNITLDEKFMPRQKGDLTIMFDVTGTYGSNYFAQVTMENHNPLGRLDNWQLSWDWMRDEFISTMKGASTSVKDSTDCIFGPQATYYAEMDFTQVLNCYRRPTIIDLPPTQANDTIFGKIPFCCRNGTILPPTMDPSKSISRFQMQVYKMPPDVNRSMLTPPQNWRINGTLNPDYKCGPPVRVSPSQFPDPSGLPVNATAIASWQVVCNITQSKSAAPKCCVSFSAYYNDSVIPCNTCACGCPKNKARTCSTTAPAMLLPPEALLVPFENRTAKAYAWADLKHLAMPRPVPCGDNCGVTINWHLLTDYNRGWSARITLFNWDETNFADWFTAIEMDKGALGFEKAYSFNGSSLEVQGVNNTIFMEGLPGLNYLVGETDGPNPLRDPRVPGKQQSVISFTKKTTPGINIAGGDGFPTKVYFNGEECSLPSICPTSGSGRHSSLAFLFVLTVLALIFMHQ